MKKDFPSASVCRHQYDFRSWNLDLNKTKVITGSEGGQTAFPSEIPTN